MTASEIADKELDIVERYKIKMDMKKLKVTYIDRGQKYTVTCFSENGVRNIAGLMVKTIFAEESRYVIR